MSPNLSAPYDSAYYRKHNSVLAWIVLVASSLICLSIDYRLRILAADDSYIHLRIATHLMTTGHGYFNLGEKVMVTSSPVWTLLLGLSAWLCHGFPAALALEAASMGLSWPRFTCSIPGTFGGWACWYLQALLATNISQC
jgi:hypothetical protein